MPKIYHKLYFKLGFFSYLFFDFMPRKWKYIKKLHNNSESVILFAKRSWSEKILVSGLFPPQQCLILPDCNNTLWDSICFFRREQITGSLSISVGFSIITDQCININPKWIGHSLTLEAAQVKKILCKFVLETAFFMYFKSESYAQQEQTHWLVT